MKVSGLLIVLILIVCTLTVALLLKYVHKNKQSTESFIDIPHDIKADYREDVSEFLDQYSSLAQQVCAVQGAVIDGIAKTNLGIQGGTAPTKQDLAAAQMRAKDMAGGPIFNCSALESQKAALAKDPLTIKDLYNVFDDIPDNVGLRFYNSAKFSLAQLSDTYKQIQGTLSAAVAGTAALTKAEGFADMPQETAHTIPNRCKTNELCPDEMSQEILQRLPKLKASLEQTKKGFLPSTTPISDLLKEAKDLNDKLNVLKEKAQAGTLIGPSATASSSSESK